MSKSAQIITYENSQTFRSNAPFQNWSLLFKVDTSFSKFGVPKTVPLIFGNKNTDFKVW